MWPDAFNWSLYNNTLNRTSHDREGHDRDCSHDYEREVSDLNHIIIAIIIIVIVICF